MEVGTEFRLIKMPLGSNYTDVVMRPESLVWWNGRSQTGQQPQRITESILQTNFKTGGKDIWKTGIYAVQSG